MTTPGGGGWGNPAVGGTVLRIPAIQSPNFVAGVSGWAIFQDGSAEFNNITIPSGSGGATIYVQPTQPTTANPGDLWFQTNGSGIVTGTFSTPDGTTWPLYQFGTGALGPGSVTADLIAANAIVAGMIAAGAIDGMVINAPVINGGTISATDIIASGNNGGVFVYGTGGGRIVVTFTSSGTWTAPAGVTSAKVEVIAGGNTGQTGSSSTGGGTGAGGAEYAAENANTVVPGDAYTVTVGGNGASSSFSGPSATTVTAHAGSSGASGGAGGTGSTNSVHNDGGPGGAGSPGTTTTDTFGPGSGNWVCPTGVTSATVKCLGPGSGAVGGGTAGGANSGGYGGAGGALAQSVITTIPGHSYPYSVGSGGAGGAANSNGSSGSGATSFNSGQVSADFARVSGGGVSTPGSAASSTGTIRFGGGGGGTASGSGGGGGGSSGGTLAAGNAGVSNTGSGSVAGGTGPTGGYAGAASGAANSNGTGNFGHGTGGGGGGGGGSAGSGGAGGSGLLSITYVLPSNAGGGGGGGSGSATSAGNAGTAGSAGTGGSGAPAVSGGGNGGNGGNSGVVGSAPSSAPGGGGGGGGASAAGGAGSSGLVRITYTPTGGNLVALLAGGVGTDPELGDAFGPGLNLYPQSSPPAAVSGASLVYGDSTGAVRVIDQADGATYATQRKTLVVANDTACAAAGTTVFTSPVAIRSYLVRGQLIVSISGANQQLSIELQAPTGATGHPTVMITRAAVLVSTTDFSLNSLTSIAAAGSLTAGNKYVVDFTSIMNITAAGTFNFIIGCTNNNDLTVLANSHLSIKPV